MHHRRGLRRLLKDDSFLKQIEENLDNASNLNPRRRAMLRYAKKLTLTPKSMVEQDVQTLKDVGFSDLDILHIAEVIGYYAYVNRIADGLGVLLEDKNEV